MTDWTMQSDSVDSRILMRRLGAFVKRQGSAKQLSLLIDCDERTAFKIRAGEVWPIARHWWNIWVEFGDDVLEAVYHPERAEARLIREAEERANARRQRIASAARSAEPIHFSGAPGLGESLGPDDEPAELGPPNLDLFEAEPRNQRAMGER
jgi:hypothetical protein